MIEPERPRSDVVFVAFLQPVITCQPCGELLRELGSSQPQRSVEEKDGRDFSKRGRSLPPSYKPAIARRRHDRRGGMVNTFTQKAERGPCVYRAQVLDSVPARDHPSVRVSLNETAHKVNASNVHL